MGYRSCKSFGVYSMQVRAESGKVNEFGGDTVWCSSGRRVQEKLLGQSRGTGPIMYLL